MTIEDLTVEQRWQLQKTCLMDFRDFEKLFASCSDPIPSGYELWKHAFSKGLIAGLGMPIRTTAPPGE